MTDKPMTADGAKNAHTQPMTLGEVKDKLTVIKGGYDITRAPHAPIGNGMTKAEIIEFIKNLPASTCFIQWVYPQNPGFNLIECLQEKPNDR